MPGKSVLFASLVLQWAPLFAIDVSLKDGTGGPGRSREDIGFRIVIKK